MAAVASWSTPVWCELLAPAYIYQSNIRGVSPSVCLHEAWKCIPLMCDHYTNEVNGSAVLTIRWMPPSGTAPLDWCVALWCASFKLLCVCVCLLSAAPRTPEGSFSALTFLHVSPGLPLSAEASSSARGVRAALNRPELSLNFTNGCDELMTSCRLLREGKLLAFFFFWGGGLLFSFFLYFLLITNAKTSEAFYKLGFCLCPATCYWV